MLTPEELKYKIIRLTWEDAAFKAKLIANPKAAVKEAFGVDIPANVNVQVLSESDNQFYLVLPSEPSTVLVGGSNEPRGMW
ncbi:NHLP leader peptide family RiPP precursor [Paenibacillus sp. YYML68]|uniref:NHLP leader peptide family RiPP precursor n=1 Tax=Paenibacillus sp. YYML68 TaxID=2909250 RepID=UPI00249323A4|nr:NHLP leader peptide family RiPP precursor [Paenibacillus sp. YYML68]